MSTREQESHEGGRMRQAASRALSFARRADQHPKVVAVAKSARERLPGDSRYGDPLSTTGPDRPQAAGRRLSEITQASPGALREMGFGALQVWQAVSEAQGRGRGHEERAILFTDLVGFSDWAMAVGDDLALDLLRDVSETIEPPVRSRGGEVVKWLGDGMMAVFEHPQGALDAALEAFERLGSVKADGYEPRLRAGLHFGRPRRLGGDYLGVDVNIAARVAEASAPDELLVSDRALGRLDTEELQVRKKRRFNVKGVPDDVGAYSVSSG